MLLDMGEERQGSGRAPVFWENHQSGVGFELGSPGICSCSGLRPPPLPAEVFQLPCSLLLGDLMQGEL